MRRTGAPARVSERYHDANRVRLLCNGAEAFPAMLDAIAAARRQVLFEMYWFANDTIGRRFADELGRAAERGVEVALIYDSFGSVGTPSTFFDDLVKRGVRVVEYHPLAVWHRRFHVSRLSRRDHRKLLVVDGRIGFTGGINISDVSLPHEEDGGGWRDDMFEIEGPALVDAISCFEGVFGRQDGGSLADLRSNAKPVGSQRARVLGQASYRDNNDIARAYWTQLSTARRRIWIANAYFVPEPKVVRALRTAARAGVDVRVLVPAVNDVEIMRHASRAVWMRLMRHGVRIFEWQPSMLHSKTAVIDGQWCTTGTFNLDYRSVWTNLEINVAIEDELASEQVERAFERDLEHAREVHPNDLRWRSLGDRVLESLCYRLRYFL